ncbi:hypothetical protein SLA2020_111110 [Shorea laevis]
MAAPTEYTWILLHGFKYAEPLEGTSSHRVEQMETKARFIIKRNANGSQVEMYKDLLRKPARRIHFNAIRLRSNQLLLNVLSARGHIFLT